MIVEIPIFDGGLVTNVDAEDIPINASTLTENFDVDVLGKLKKRKGLESKGTLTGTHLTQLFYWVDDNLTGGANWIGYESQSKQIVKFNKDFTSKSVLNTFSGTQPSDIKIIPLANGLRFANGKDQDAGFLQYIDRSFFFSAYSFDGLKYDTASPTYPTTWTLTNEGTEKGILAGGTYYYKATPVFDGVQEAQLEDQFFKVNVSGDDDAIHLSLTIDTDDYNPRITGVNLYRHYAQTDNITPVYRLIKKINLATKSSSTDTESGHSNANIGNVVYFHEGGLNSVATTAYNYADNAGSDAQVAIYINNTDYYLINDAGATSGTYTDSLFTLSSGTFPAGVSNWDTTVTIRAYWRDGQGATQSQDYTLQHGYYGRDMVYDGRTSNNWNWAVGEKTNWIQTIGSQNLAVLNSIGRVIELNAESTTIGANQTIGALTNGYYYESLAGNQYKIHFKDVSSTNDRVHPLATTKNKVNYTHGAFVNGRFFAGDVSLDPDGEDERHDDFIIFSSINQPDILPVSNFIQIKDSQGGKIIAMRSVNDNLMVFMEKGVYQLYAPNANPSNYNLRESDVNIGCVATNSIVEAGQYIFFASNDNIYMTGAGMSSVPVANNIKDIYTGTSNKDQTIGVYDPLKNRVLFRFGNDGTALYALDYDKITNGVESWNKLTFASAKSVDLLSIDADLKIYTTHNES